MEEINFTIRGNPDDPVGNPLPKLKMTSAQQWTPRAQKYAQWKKHVQSALFGVTRDHLQNLAVYGKPIILAPREQARMRIMIRWKDGKHGDPENIFGSVADALFKDDKRLSGSFDFDPHPTGKGEVDVRITIENF